MTEQEKRAGRCCFTGHRPEKLPGNETAIRARLAQAIEAALRSNIRTFISGMAWGVDLWAAELVLQYRALHPEIRLICALPHPDFDQRMPRPWRQRYQEVIAQADLVRTISPVRTDGCYQARNIWMVNHSARVIAVYAGVPGGTRNTLAYARAQDVDILLIDPRISCI